MFEIPVMTLPVLYLLTTCCSRNLQRATEDNKPIGLSNDILVVSTLFSRKEFP